MSHIFVCRGCLSSATESKLVDMRQHGLIAFYDELLHNTKLVCNRLPPYMCSYCIALLLKCAAFRDKCVKAQEILQGLLHSNTQVTDEHISIINKSSKPLTIQHNTYTIDCTHTHIKVKEESTVKKEEEDKKEDANEVFVNEVDGDKNSDVNDNTNDKQLYMMNGVEIDTRKDIEEVKKEHIESNKRKTYDTKKTFSETEKETDEDKPETKKIKAHINKRKKIKNRKIECKLTNVLNKKCRVENCDKEAEVRETIKEICSDSDIDHVLDEINGVSDGERKNKSEKLEENKEENDLNSDEETNVEQILKGLGDSEAGEIDDVINYVCKQEGKDNGKRIKEKRFHKNKREYIPLVDEATFLKRFDMIVVIMTEQEQREEFQSRRNSKNYIDAPYKCNKCFRGWQRVEPLNSHMEKHNPKNGRLCCEICTYRYNSEKNYRKHLQSHRYKLVCRRCGFETRSRYYARLHYRRHKGHTFTCQYCNAVFKSSSGQLAHVRLRHASHHYACARCGEAFVGQRGLQVHITHTRGLCAPATPCPGSNESTADSKHNCPLCNKTFMSAASLEIHRQRVHLNIPLKEKRGLAHSIQKNMKRHICEICGKGFNAKTQLAHHQMLHEGNKPFNCSHCPKTFMTKVSLQTHMRVHSGEKPFQCTQCGQAFASQSSHWRHKIIHTNEKRYKCDICEKMFTQSGSVKLHVRTVHMKQPAPPRRRARDGGRTKEPLEGRDPVGAAPNHTHTEASRVGPQ